ncbi:hypothetical protein ACPA0F_18480 [Solibacillus silvestris]
MSDEERKRIKDEFENLPDEEKERIKEGIRQLKNKVEKDRDEHEQWLKGFRKSMKILRFIGLFYLITLSISFILLILSLFFEELNLITTITLTFFNAATVVFLIYVHERNKKVLDPYPPKLKLMMWLALLVNMCLVAYNFWQII